MASVEWLSGTDRSAVAAASAIISLGTSPSEAAPVPGEAILKRRGKDLRGPSGNLLVTIRPSYVYTNVTVH